mmetsp:Transcript_101057/g.170936  ORF Transcript_101057/g.170936 Transcript_101057/m.170936 type:complete len:87 (-) Transcript_101057:68-328(-)
MHQRTMQIGRNIYGWPLSSLSVPQPQGADTERLCIHVEMPIKKYNQEKRKGIPLISETVNMLLRWSLGCASGGYQWRAAGCGMGEG